MKIFLVVFLTVMGCLHMHPSSTPITVIIRKQPTSPIGGSGSRGPIMNLSIDMTFNDETGELTVVSEETLSGCVYVMNMEGEQECYSPILDCTVIIPKTEDVHIITLQGGSWSGDTKIVY